MWNPEAALTKPEGAPLEERERGEALLKEGEIEACVPIEGALNVYSIAIKETEQAIERAIYRPEVGDDMLSRMREDRPKEFADVRGSLAQREMAAYIVSEELGFGTVPPTVWREDAPKGSGVVQKYVEGDTLYEAVGRKRTKRGQAKLLRNYKKPLVIMAAFDDIIGNPDRNGGGVIIGPEGKLWAVDNNWSFSRFPLGVKEPEVHGRYRGKMIDRHFCERLMSFHEDEERKQRLREKLQPFLEHPQDIEDLFSRIEIVARTGRIGEVELKPYY